MAFADLVLLGDAHGNTLSGDNGDDRIAGNDGNDIINAGGGKDLLLGGKGNDFMHGGGGADILHGGVGDDHLFGGSGTDYLSGDAGRDYLCGGFGADTFAFNVAPSVLGTGVDFVSDFTLGEDRIAIVNGSAANVTFADEGRDVGVFYDGVKIATLKGVGDIPADTDAFFGAIFVV